MKCSAAFLLLLLLVSFAGAQQKTSASGKEKAATHPAASSFKTEMQKMADDWKAGFQAKDADKVVAMYSDDAVWVTPEGTFHGPNEIKGQLKKMIDRGDTVTAIVTTRTVHSAQVAYAEGTYSGTAPDQSEKQAPGSGSWVVSLKNVAGAWKLATHTSVPGAAAGSMSKPATKPE